MSSLNISGALIETLEILSESDDEEPLLQRTKRGEMSTSTKKRSKNAIDFDSVLKHVGPLGTWQYLHLFLLFWVPMCGGIAVVTFAFTGYVPSHRCLIPQCENINNATYLSNNAAYANLTIEAILRNKVF